jgi:hypothetical protein
MKNQYPYLEGQDLGWFNTALSIIEQPVKSYVYFIEASCPGFDPLIKIGLTVDPERRFKEIEHEVGESKYAIDWLELGVARLKVRGMIEGTQPLETAFHKAFRKNKAGREWFWLTEQMDCVIDNLLCDYCGCDLCKYVDMCDAIHIPHSEIIGDATHEPI